MTPERLHFQSIKSMPNQRSLNKVRVTVPMEKELEREIQECCKKSGMNRVDLIKAACAAFVEHQKEQSTNDNRDTRTTRRQIAK
jgi:metal-responsive CopG/Arc/MetJ family transcriptional regulator